MTFQIYRSDDAGAPSFVGNTGLTPYITLLDACLVNGYGSKPGLGWTKPFSGTNLAVYLMGGSGPKAYLRIDNTSSFGARVRGYTAMTDVNTGSDPFPTDSQLSGGLYWTTSSSANSSLRPWIVYGNERFFYIHTWSASGNSLLNTIAFDGSSYCISACFGAFISNVAGDLYPFMLHGGDSQSTSQRLNQSSGILSPSLYAYCARNYLQQPNTARQMSKGFMGIASLSATSSPGGTSWPPYPNEITNDLGIWPGMLLGEITASGKYAIRGRCPAALMPMNDLYTVRRYFDTFSDAAGNRYLIVPDQGPGATVVQISPVHPDWALN